MRLVTPTSVRLKVSEMNNPFRDIVNTVYMLEFLECIYE